TLVRRADARTHPENGLSVGRCFQCNAPLSETLTTTCDFCRAELSGDPRDWLLDEHHGYNTWYPSQDRSLRLLVESGRADLNDARVREWMVYALLSTAHASEGIQQWELNLARTLAERWWVKWLEVEPLIPSIPQMVQPLRPGS